MWDWCTLLSWLFLVYVVYTQRNPNLGLFSATLHYLKEVKCVTVREWGILCLFSGCMECNVTLVEIRKGLFAVVMYMLPVVARGQGKGLTLPFQTEILMGFYSFSLCMLRDWSTGLVGSAAGESVCPKVLRSTTSLKWLWWWKEKSGSCVCLQTQRALRCVINAINAVVGGSVSTSVGGKSL